MSIRSKWCDVDKETKKYIKNRDKYCVLCGNTNCLTMAHVFISRAHGDRGCKENIVALCMKCHKYFDNPIGLKERELSITNNYKVKKYLIEKENITVNKEFLESLKYKKQITPFETKIKPKLEKKCKHCIYLVKNKKNNSTIPNYYCKKLNKIMGKNTLICNNFKEQK